LHEFGQSTEPGEGTLHLEQALRHREIRRADLYWQFDLGRLLPAPNELDLPEDN
jgi:hypothetical protein